MMVDLRLHFLLLERKLVGVQVISLKTLLDQRIMLLASHFKPSLCMEISAQMFGKCWCLTMGMYSCQLTYPKQKHGLLLYYLKIGNYLKRSTPLTFIEGPQGLYSTW